MNDTCFDSQIPELTEITIHYSERVDSVFLFLGFERQKESIPCRMNKIGKLVRTDKEQAMVLSNCFRFTGLKSCFNWKRSLRSLSSAII